MGDLVRIRVEKYEGGVLVNGSEVSALRRIFYYL